MIYELIFKLSNNNIKLVKLTKKKGEKGKCRVNFRRYLRWDHKKDRGNGSCWLSWFFLLQKEVIVKVNGEIKVRSVDNGSGKLVYQKLWWFSVIFMLIKFAQIETQWKGKR